MEAFSFSAEIFIIGVNPYVYLPDTVLQNVFEQAGRDRGAIPVKGTLNEKPFVQTLIKYAGYWRLYVNGIMRKAAGIDVGDTAHVVISYDPTPRLEQMPQQLEKALSRNKKAKEEFEKLSPSRKKEILRYLNSMKTEESLLRNIEKVILHLLGEKPEGLYALMHRKP